VCDDLGKRSLQSTRPQGGFFSIMGEFLLFAMIIAIVYKLL